jgi:hypothetical protein
MGLIRGLTNYLIRKSIYMDFKNTVYKVTDGEYFLKNEAVSSTIRLHEDNGQQFFLCNVKTIDKGNPLINFAVTYDTSVNMDDFIIEHCKNNPVFMIDEMDSHSITSCTLDVSIRGEDRLKFVQAEPIFIDEVKLNKWAFELSLDTKFRQHLHHCLYLARRVSRAEFQFKFDNTQSFVVGTSEYQVIALNKKKITKYVSKITLGLSGGQADFREVLTVYDINGVVCVKKNIFDIVELGRNMDWMLYADGHQIEAIIMPMLKYLNLYVDLFEPTLLFHKNSPCRISRDKHSVKLDYIDGHRSCLVNVHISKHGYQNSYSTLKKITKDEMSDFFGSILNDVKSNVFKICANSPSGLLLNHLSGLGFHDCQTPINHDIIEVLKMHDY